MVIDVEDTVKRFWELNITKEYSSYRPRGRKPTKEERLEYFKNYYQENNERVRSMIKTNKANLKVKILTHYGGSECKCVRCGFDDIRALALDHINNDGAVERRGQENGGVALYRRLRNTGYPEGYQTLCFNCNIIKYREHLEKSHREITLKGIEKVEQMC